MFETFFVILCLCFIKQINADYQPWHHNLPQISNAILIPGRPLTLPQNFTKFQLSHLSGVINPGSFSMLHKVDEIRIVDSHVTGIEPNGLCSAPNLRILELDFSTNKVPPVIYKDIFTNCLQLEELSLSFHAEHRPRISDDTFQILFNLKELFLQNQEIDHLTNRLFMNLRWLRVLSLNNCHIQQIDSNAFEELGNLKKIRISNNRGLTYLPSNLFTHTPLLEVLVLNDNRISDITWNEFNGLSYLKELSLAGNRIFYFDADKTARFMPMLQRLYIERNPSSCMKKQDFANSLQAKLDHPIMVVYRLDPGFYDDCKYDDYH